MTTEAGERVTGPAIAGTVAVVGAGAVLAGQVSFDQVLVAGVVAFFLGAVKKIAPVVKAGTPNWAWPLLAYALAHYTTQGCSALGIACSGSPLDWNGAQANDAVVGLMGIATREFAVGVQWLYLRVFGTAVQQLKHQDATGVDPTDGPLFQ